MESWRRRRKKFRTVTNLFCKNNYKYFLLIIFEIFLNNTTIDNQWPKKYQSNQYFSLVKKNFIFYFFLWHLFLYILFFIFKIKNKFYFFFQKKKKLFFYFFLVIISINTIAIKEELSINSFLVFDYNGYKQKKILNFYFNFRVEDF